MLIRFGVVKKIKGTKKQMNDKIIIQNGDWEDEKTHAKIKRRIRAKYPDWNIHGYCYPKHKA